MPDPRLDPLTESCMAAIVIECQLEPGHDGPHYADDDGRVYQWMEPDA